MSLTCICCGLGERWLKRIYWLLWTFFGFAPRLIEHAFLGPLIEYLDYLIQTQTSRIFSGFFLSLLVSYGIITPLALHGKAQRTWCVYHIVTSCWWTGQLFMALLAYYGWITRFALKPLCRTLKLSTLSEGTYLGFLLGSALTLLSSLWLDLLNDYSNSDVWCTPSASLTVFFVYFTIAILGAFVAVARSEVAIGYTPQDLDLHQQTADSPKASDTM